MIPWYQRDFLRSLVDMHIPAGEGYLEKFDPAKYAENIAKSGASVAYIYSSNCLGLCFYPTKYGIRHPAAERDIFGETVRECRRRGLDVVGYTNSWGSYVVDEHPEWSVVLHDGITMRDTSRFGNPCPNQPGYRAYILDRVKELASSYDLDGLWIDMVGMWTPVCYCSACREKYRKETGRELPLTVDWNDPDFVDYFRFKGACVAEYAEEIRATALAANPKLTVSLQSASIRNPYGRGLSDPRYYRCSDYVAGDFYTDRAGINVISRMLYKLTENLPFEFMTSRCATLESHTMNKSVADLTLLSFFSLMYRGAFLFIDAIDPDGQMDERFYRQMASVREKLTPYLPYTDYSETALREVAVYGSLTSAVTPEDNGKPAWKMTYDHTYRRLRGIWAALSASHIDFDIIGVKQLDRLSDYRVIVLSSIELLTAKEAEAIRAYVAGGGKAYISGITSIRDGEGHLFDDFMLADVLGLHYNGRFGRKPFYLAPCGEKPEIFGAYTARYPNMLTEDAVKVRADGDGEALATVTLPIGDKSDRNVFSSAISDPPMVPTDSPAIYRHRYGKGEILYCAGILEADELPDNRTLFCNLINSLLEQPRVTVEAPACVDHSVYVGKEGLKIYLLNAQTVQPPIPIPAVTVTVLLDGLGTPERVEEVSGGNVEWTVSDGKLRLTAPLDVISLITVKFAPSGNER